VDIGLIMTAMLATAANTGCSWAQPGANPYRGDPVAALGHFRMPEPTRRKLRALMATHRYTDVVRITRDDIRGEHGYGDLRDMHSGGGQRCQGEVDRSAWDPRREERGLVYCADDSCVIVPTICNNVSLVTRRPETAGPDDGPLDIEPAAGPPPTPAGPPAPLAAANPDAPGDFGRAEPGFVEAGPATDGIDLLAPGNTDFATGAGAGAGASGGNGAGVSAVPELPGWAALLSGLVLLGLPGRLRGRQRAP
jgi:hypothetical protein